MEKKQNSAEAETKTEANGCEQPQKGGMSAPQNVTFTSKMFEGKNTAQASFP